MYVGSFYSWSIKSGTVPFQSLKHFILRSKMWPFIGLTHQSCYSAISRANTAPIFTIVSSSSLATTFKILTLWYILSWKFSCISFFFFSCFSFSLLKLYKDIPLRFCSWWLPQKYAVIDATRKKEKKVIFYFFLHFNFPFSGKS